MFLLNFLVGGVVSFLGSLPLGVLNLTAIQISVQRGTKAAWRFAWACAIVEFFYAYLAVWLTQTVLQTEWLNLLVQGVSVVTVVGIGLYYLRKQNASEVVFAHVGAFRLGTVLSIANMVAIPFWLVYTAFLSRLEWVSISSHALIGAYVVGISVGTLAAILFFAASARSLVRRLTTSQRRINQCIGWTLLVAGAYQVGQWLVT